MKGEWIKHQTAYKNYIRHRAIDYYGQPLQNVSHDDVMTNDYTLLIPDANFFKVPTEPGCYQYLKFQIWVKPGVCLSGGIDGNRGLLDFLNDFRIHAGS